MNLGLSGFRPGEHILVTMFSTPRTMPPATADADGRTNYRMTVPLNTGAGAHRLVFTASASLVVNFRVAPQVLGRPAPSLPQTGAPLGALLLAGWTCLAVGVSIRRSWV